MQLRRGALALAVLCLFAAMAAAPAAADKEGERSERSEKSHDAELRMEERWSRAGPEQQEKALARAEAHKMFGRITANPDGSFAGSHVNGTFAADGSVRGYTVDNTTFVASFAPSLFTLVAPPRATGAVLRMAGDTVSYTVHNNPTGELRIRAADNVTVTITLGSGTSTQVMDSHEVRLNHGNLHAHVLAHGNTTLAVTPTTVTYNLGPGDSLAFKAHPANADTGQLHGENEAFKRGLLGASVRIADGGGVAVQDEDGEDAVQANTTVIRKGYVELEVGSQEHAGRIVTLVFSNDTLDPARLAKLQVKLGSTVVLHVNSMDGLLATNATGVFLVSNAATGQVFVVLRIPHFSSYALAISDPLAGSGETTSATDGSPAASGTDAGSSAAGGASSTGTPGFATVAAVAAVALALLAAVRSRRNE